MTMPDDTTKKKVTGISDALKDPVTPVVFSRDDTIAIPGHECPACKDFEGSPTESSLLEKIMAAASL